MYKSWSKSRYAIWRNVVLAESWTSDYYSILFFLSNHYILQISAILHNIANGRHIGIN